MICGISLAVLKPCLIPMSLSLSLVFFPSLFPCLYPAFYPEPPISIKSWHLLLSTSSTLLEQTVITAPGPVAPLLQPAVLSAPGTQVSKRSSSPSVLRYICSSSSYAHKGSRCLSNPVSSSILGIQATTHSSALLLRPFLPSSRLAPPRSQPSQALHTLRCHPEAPKMPHCVFCCRCVHMHGEGRGGWELAGGKKEKILPFIFCNSWKFSNLRAPGAEMEKAPKKVVGWDLCPAGGADIGAWYNQ